MYLVYKNSYFFMFFVIWKFGIKEAKDTSKIKGDNCFIFWYMNRGTMKCTISVDNLIPNYAFLKLIF